MHYRPLYRFLLLPAIMLWQTVAAQADVEAVIADCAATSSYDGRVRCLEAALRATSNDDASAAAADKAASNDPVAKDVVDDSPAGSPPAQGVAHIESDRQPVQAPAAGGPTTNPAAAITAVSSVPPDIAAQAAGRAKTSLSAVADETAPPAAAAQQQVTRGTTPVATTGVDIDAEVQRFGLSETERKETIESITVTIIAIEKDAFGKQIFNTEDGQVWRQTEPSAPRYRDLPFEAEIRKAAMGSFFMRPVSGSRSIRVRRSR